jgi:hypothetical protein
MFDRAKVAEQRPDAASRRRERAEPLTVQPVLQKNLRVGAANDPAERAADRFADAVMGALRSPPDSDPAASLFATESTRIVRSAARSEVGLDGGDVPDDVARGIRASTGAPLDGTTRATMESATGVDLAAVRVHTDSAVPSRIQASAFTLGTDIHFAPGQYRPTTRAGQWLLGHELAHVVQQGGADRARRVVRRYKIRTDTDGDTWRVSESGKTALCVTQNEGGQMLFATKDLISQANKALKKAGNNGSFVRLAIDESKGLKAGILKGVANDVSPVTPKLVTVGPDPGDKKLKLINEGKLKDDDGTKSSEFALWADCGRSSRAVMGTAMGPRAHARIGSTSVESGSSADPAAFTSLYKQAIPQFMAVKANGKYLKKGIHYTGGGLFGKRQLITAATDDEAKRQYWDLGKAGRKAFDAFTGINLAADPEIGGAYTLVTEENMPGFTSSGSTWNFHWAGVVMKDGPNNITLENYAVSYGSDPDPVVNKQLQQKAYDEVNRKYVFQMYGTEKKDQTFHEEHLASGTHGTRGSTFGVKA